MNYYHVANVANQGIEFEAAKKFAKENNLIIDDSYVISLLGSTDELRKTHTAMVHKSFFSNKANALNSEWREVKKNLRTKDVYGVVLSRKDAFAFNYFKNNYSSFLPAMNTIYAEDRKYIVQKWKEDREQEIDEKKTALFMENKYLK